MKHTHLSTLILTALLASSLVSCGGDTAVTQDSTDAVTTADTAAETEELDALAQRMLVDDGLEDKDFGGRTFRILGDEECVNHYLMEEQTGDVMDDAVYERNLAVTERFNIVLEAEVFEESQMAKTLKNSVMAADDAYQLFSGHIIYAGNAVCDNVYYNLNELPNIDFSKPWWSQSTIDDLSYDGKAFIAMGDFALSTIYSTYCFFYNKQIAAEYDMEDMYGIVNEGKWTVDRLTAISKEVYRDLNGDGAADENDLYGFAMWARSPVNAFLWSFGEKLGKKQDDGTIVLDYYNAKVIEIYEKLYELCCVNETTFCRTDVAEGELMKSMFTDGKALFTADTFQFASKQLRDVETDYGILPYPKWDEAQEGYYTMVDGGHEGIAVPVSVADPEFVGTITEALNAESYKRTVPVYYDIVLKTKGSRDEESVRMLDMIFDGRIFDFGYVYGEFGAAFWPQYLVEKKSADIASYYEKNHKSYDKKIANAIEFFEEYENT